jgi:hypothetical protein
VFGRENAGKGRLKAGSCFLTSPKVDPLGGHLLDNLGLTQRQHQAALGFAQVRLLQQAG